MKNLIRSFPASVAVIVSLLAVPNGVAFAATCAQLSSGASCMSTCATADIVSGASDCGFLTVCCKAAIGSGTCASIGGACQSGTSGQCPTGYNIAAGTCSDAAAPLCCKPTAAATTGSCTAAGGVCETSCSAGRSPNSAYTCSAGICCTSATAATSGSASTVTFTNPLAFDTVQGATAAFLDAFQQIIVWLALLFIVLGGIFYITSAGDEKRIGTAKKMITAALIGLAIGVAAPSFLKVIGDVLGWGGAQVPTQVSQAKSAVQIVQGILNFLLGITGLLAIIMFVIGGFMFFAAAGDEKRAETAKSIIKYSVAGVAVVILSLIVIRTVAGLFS